MLDNRCDGTFLYHNFPIWNSTKKIIKSNESKHKQFSAGTIKLKKKIFHLVFLGDNVVGGFSPGTLLSKYNIIHENNVHDNPFTDGHNKWLQFSDSQFGNSWTFSKVRILDSISSSAADLPAVIFICWMCYE